MAHPVDAWVHADERPFFESFLDFALRAAGGEQLHPSHNAVLQGRDSGDDLLRCVV